MKYRKDQLADNYSRNTIFWDCKDCCL